MTVADTRMSLESRTRVIDDPIYGLPTMSRGQQAGTSLAAGSLKSLEDRLVSIRTREIEGKRMRALNLVTLCLITVGGLNWLLVGIFQFDLVAGIFGGQMTSIARTIYILVGLAALWQLNIFIKSQRTTQVHDERDGHR